MQHLQVSQPVDVMQVLKNGGAQSTPSCNTNMWSKRCDWKGKPTLNPFDFASTLHRGSPSSVPSLSKWKFELIQLLKFLRNLERTTTIGAWCQIATLPNAKNEGGLPRLECEWSGNFFRHLRMTHQIRVGVDSTLEFPFFSFFFYEWRYHVGVN